MVKAEADFKKFPPLPPLKKKKIQKKQVLWDYLLNNTSYNVLAKKKKAEATYLKMLLLMNTGNYGYTL